MAAFFIAFVATVVATVVATDVASGERPATERRWLLLPQRTYSMLKVPLRCCIRCSIVTLADNSIRGRRALPLAR